MASGQSVENRLYQEGSSTSQGGRCRGARVKERVSAYVVFHLAKCVTLVVLK